MSLRLRNSDRQIEKALMTFCAHRGNLDHCSGAERDRRVLSGTAMQESAAKHAVKGPPILAGIMTDESSNPRHKIDAFQALRQTAIGSNADRPATAAQFIIKIDLTAGGGDVEMYSHAPQSNIKIDASDGDSPNNLIPLGGKPDGNE